MTVTDEIKQKADIVEVVGQFTKLTKSGKTFKGLCPFHSEKSPSFFVYPAQQSWHCFGACNTGGDVFSFIMKKQGIDFGEALRFLSERTGIPLPSRPEVEADRKGKERLYQVNDAAAKYYHDLLLNSPAAEKARNYVASRGLSAQSIADFQLGYSLDNWTALKQHLTQIGYTEAELLTAGLIIKAEDSKVHDRFRNKLMFPICDIRGHVTGFGSRVLDDSLPKYINSPQTPVFDKSGSLYGINLTHEAIKEQNLAVLVEGYIDVILAHQYGFHNVVAPMGTAINDKHVGILRKLSKNLTLALDADAAGVEASWRGGEIASEPSEEDLSPRLDIDPNSDLPLNEATLRKIRRIGMHVLDSQIKVARLPTGKDPDEVIKENPETWKELLSTAIPIFDHIINTIKSKLDTTTENGKSEAIEKLLPMVAEIKDPVRQLDYLQKLSRHLKVNVNSLESALKLQVGKKQFKMEQKSETVSRVLRSALSSPIEEYTLALLLKHPEFKTGCGNVPPDYFENSENREIYLAYLQSEDVQLQLIREKIDPAIWEHFDSLSTKNMPSNRKEEKFTQCTLRLREKYLKNLETKKEALLALEAESKGTAAELAKLQEQGIDVSVQLGEIFTQRRGGRGKGDKK